jgi:hypothetical protein
MEAERADRIAELEAELDRLDPRRRAVRVGESQRMAMERTLDRARKVDADGYMARAVAEFDRRREIQRQREAQAGLTAAERELARAYSY